MNTSTAKTKRLFPAVVVLCLMALGAILTAGRIHGFSFSAWHDAIDGSPQREVFWNDAKGYRSDDWLVALPQALAQRADTPAFPAANRLIGDGRYNMVITGAAPVRNLIALFRPQVWGYFISGDVGMAFQWWFNVLGIWIAVWLVLRRLTAHDFCMSVCGATALLFSPFLQAWSLNAAPSVIFACGTLLTLDQLWTAPSIRRSLLAALFLTWCGGAFLLTLNYLPYLITLLYLVLFVFVGLAVGLHYVARQVAGRACPAPSGIAWQAVTCPDSSGRRDKRQVLPVNIGIRWIFTLLAVVCLLGLGVYLVASNRETINVIRHSDYPGQRVSTGGDQTVWHLFRGNMLSVKPPKEWRDFNACEGAAFFMVFPLVVAALIRDWWRTRKPPNALVLGLLAYILFLLIWNLAGFPETLSRWTLMNRAPPFRTLIGLGIADLFLLAVYGSSCRQPASAARKEAFTPWIVCLLWVGFHIALGIKLSRYFPEYPLSTALTAGLFTMALAPLLYLAPRWVLPAVMVASILTTYNINPVARGGMAFIEENPLSRKIRALDEESLKQGRQPIWVAYGDLAMPNLFRMIGSRCLNGVHAYPQFEFWKTLDPEGKDRPVYNRYAHVVFELPSTPDGFRIHLVQTDIISVFLHPDDPRLAALNVDYLLCLDNHVDALDRVPRLRKVFSHAGKHIFKVIPAP